MSKQYRPNTRADHTGTQRRVYEKNRAKLLKEAKGLCYPCALCGRPIDYSLKYPNPLCATIDHIQPLSKLGHPTDLDNLQVAHFICNRLKSNKVIGEKQQQQTKENNRKIYQTRDWKNF